MLFFICICSCTDGWSCRVLEFRDPNRLVDLDIKLSESQSQSQASVSVSLSHCLCQNIHTSHIRFGDVVVLTTTFIWRCGHATYDQPGATRGSRLRVTVHTSRGEHVLRGVTRTSSFHPRSSRPIRFLRISYHTRHPSRAPAPCLGHQLPRPEPLRSPTGTSTTILARERAVLCLCGCARLFAHNFPGAR